MLAYIRGALKGGDKAAPHALGLFRSTDSGRNVPCLPYIFRRGNGCSQRWETACRALLCPFVFMVYCVVSVIFGTFSVLSKLFMAKDNGFWPIPAYLRARFFSKFTSCLFKQSFAFSLFHTASCVIFGLRRNPAAYPLGLLFIWF